MLVVQQMLGHKSAAMTLDVNADLFLDDLEAVAERLDARATTATDVGKMWASVGIRTPLSAPEDPRPGIPDRGSVVGRVGLEPTIVGL
ncbi:MAG: putative prophage phiRv2 integrase, partial [Microbacterium sp.]|nr:putative prophage phiRv2 integrase [Microbacterium sp.]